MTPDRFAPLPHQDAALLFGELRALVPDCALGLAYYPAEHRAAGLTLARFAAEAANIPARVSEPMMGAIRVQWWRDALDEAFGAAPVRKHPLAMAIGLTLTPYGPGVKAALDAMLDAVPIFLAPGENNVTLDEAAAMLAPFDGAAAALAATVLGADEEAAAAARRMASAAALARTFAIPPTPARSDAIETPYQRAAGILARAGTTPPEMRAFLTRAASLRGKRLGDAAVTAALPACLARSYAKGREPGPLAKRLRMTRAVARGRV